MAFGAFIGMPDAGSARHVQKYIRYIPPLVYTLTYPKRAPTEGECLGGMYSKQEASPSRDQPIFVVCLDAAGLAGSASRTVT